MSLIKAFKDWYYEPEVKPDPVPAPARQSRAAPPAPPVVVEKKFNLGDSIWLYVPQQSNRVLHVSNLDETEGELLTEKQQASLAKWGVCYQAHCITANDEYWRRPSESGVHERILSHHLRSAPPNHFQLVMQLRYKHEPIGMWLKVVLEEQEQPSPDDLAKVQLAPI